MLLADNLLIKGSSNKNLSNLFIGRKYNVSNSFNRIFDLELGLLRIPIGEKYKTEYISIEVVTQQEIYV